MTTALPLGSLLAKRAATNPVSSLARLATLHHGSATNGPLEKLTPVFIDVETYVNERSDISLKKQTLRQYLHASHVTAFAFAFGGEPVRVHLSVKGAWSPEAQKDLELLREKARDPNYVFVAHNAAFDIRVLRFKLAFDQPANVWCSMEGAMGAWPDLPGGFSLKNVSVQLRFPEQLRKLTIDLSPGKHTAEELERYNTRDVEVMRAAYYRQIRRLPAVEQEIALMTHAMRRFDLVVDPERLAFVMAALEQATKAAEEAASQITWDDGERLSTKEMRSIFNRGDDEVPRQLLSIRSQRLRMVMEEHFQVQLPTTSMKKLSPVIQASQPTMTAILTQASRANKALSHRRRAASFQGVNLASLELGYHRAVTGRFSSPSVGKGLSIHSVPKHDKAIAEPVRKMYQLPADLIAVRGDLANVEYRVLGWVTKSVTVERMFDERLGGSIFADPYIKLWKEMTSKDITKKDPSRQVSKSAVLGLGYMMSIKGFVMVLLQVLADPKSGVTETSLHIIAKENHWQCDRSALDRIQTETGCSRIVALAALTVHALFHERHPEFRATADWLVDCVRQVSRCHGDASAAAEQLRRMASVSNAPDPNRIRLSIDTDIGLLPSVRVNCGPWPATLTWREPDMRVLSSTNDQSTCLTIRKANNEAKRFSRQLALENVTQAAARNALCEGLLRLKRQYGHADILHVHDEVLLLVPRRRDAVLAARAALLGTFGPGHQHALGWAVLMKPDEISVTATLWEDENDIALPKFDPKNGLITGNDRWGKIERNEPGCLDGLP